MSIDNATVSVTVSPDGTFISGEVLPGAGLRTLTIYVVKSYLSGPAIDAKILSAAVNIILDSVGLPYINSHFKGIPIPQVEGITLVRPSVAVVGNAALVQTSLQFANLSVDHEISVGSGQRRSWSQG